MPSLNGNGHGNDHRRIDDVLALLEGVTQPSHDPSQYMALCPAHNDHNQSLAVRESDGGIVVLHCFAGCTASGPEPVCEALGIPVSYLFADHDSGPASKPSSLPEDYIYRDADGGPLYRIHRTKDKQFYPYVFDRQKGEFAHKAGLNGASRVLYKLDVLAHTIDRDPVFWVEGEKDADRLQAAGLLATTTAGGVNAPLPDLSPLSGRDVVIIPDNDAPGRSYAERVGEALEGIAASVKWLELPDVPQKGDVSDYLDGGGFIEALMALAITAPEFTTEGAPTRQHKRPKQRGRKKIGHDELREIWRARHPDICWSREDWHRYKNGVWTPVKEDEVEAQVIRVIEDHRDEGVDATGSVLSSVLRITRPIVFVDSTLWDANPDVLVLQNGTLEIGTRTLRDHRPEDYVTSALPFDYDPDAVAPVFQKVIQNAIPECHDFLQEFAGYSLTTDTSMETALWLKGPIGSGKSTVIEGITAMLGDRSGVLGLAEIENDNFALAEIPGKTLLTSTEQPASYMKSQHIINALISGEMLRINRKFKPTEMLRPVAKIIWAMNDLPRVSSANAGIFRRVVLMPFPKLSQTAVPAVKEAVKGEGAGILNWSLEGLSRLTERGHFNPPDVMRRATAAWEHSNDLPAQFVEEQCATDASFEVSARTLYSAYKEWALDGGHTPQSISRMKDEWERLGFRYQRTKKGRFWAGVTLRAGRDI